MQGARRNVFLLLTLTIGLVYTGHACADEKAPSRAMLGKTIPNLTFETASGKKISLDDFRDKKALVIVFFSFDCPVSNSYAQPLAKMYKEYAKRGVMLIGLTTYQEQSANDVAKLAKEFKLPFPVVVDRGFKAADALKAGHTPEAFVLDSQHVLRYRGRIDDTYYARLKRNQQISRHDLQEALDDVLAGRKVKQPATEPIGCTIVRPRQTVAAKADVTYYRDVLPILQKNCQQCHRPGEVGPFSLMSYRQAVAWADDIKTFAQKRYMPPWKLTAGLAFHNERKMTQKEIDTLAKWVDGGNAKGDRKDAPPPRQFTEGWQLGEPDLILEPKGSFQVGPSGQDVFRNFVLPTHLTEDKYVTAVEIRPGNSSILHHSLLFIDTSGQARRLEKLEQQGKLKHESNLAPGPLDKGPGYSVAMGVGFLPSGGLGGWAPGITPRHLPDGYGYFLPKGSDVVLQIHYHRNGRLEKDRTKIGIHFAKKSGTRQYQNGTMFGSDGKGPFPLFFSIPAGAEHYKLKGSVWARQDMKLFSITPHMHLLGKQIKVTMTPPGGKKTTLLEIKDWDYNWQEVYFLKKPLHIKAGTRLDVEAYYDNSANNPNNPARPPRLVTFGDQTTNEMCFVFLGGASAREGRRLPLSRTPPREKTKR